jgi:hypothetical protein
VMLVQDANAVCVTDDDDVGERMLTFLAERTAVKLVLLRGTSAFPTVHLPAARAYGIHVRALSVQLPIHLNAGLVSWHSLSRPLGRRDAPPSPSSV